MKILIIFTALLVLSACSSTKEISQPKDDKKSTKYDESFDPNSLNDDDIVIAKVESKSLETKSAETDNKVLDSEIKFREDSFYRLQFIDKKKIESSTLT
jgi:uncharacterized lipoprotein